ncbi:class I SAM-dependent RNA methyltransferase [Erythrobacteraceae bacterium CFH 75059]|nr:class I SAM-dependent RNA methyltransferase [Erythrobacteraceae bacterium CFH 75059]
MLVVRLASRGDGITADGRHVSGAAPGDRVAPDGAVLPGPHRAVPPCRHFGRCGACQLQHCDEDALAAFVTDRVKSAAERASLAVPPLLPTHLSPPRSRRVATVHAQGGRHLLLGFKENRSHAVVDLRECHVLRPDLFALLDPLRALLRRTAPRGACSVRLTATDGGVDVLISGGVSDHAEARSGLLDFARTHALARLSVDRGLGAEVAWQPHPVSVTLAGVRVTLPPGAFLQPTTDGERILQDDVRQAAGGARRAVDLFSGLGTLGLPLTGSGIRVHAFEGDRAAWQAGREALHAAANGSTASHRDLFRSPVSAAELAGVDFAVLDPPRAGARQQVEQLAASAVPKIAYVSCNPASWAADAARLATGGYRLAALRAVGQFRWSTHVELFSLFTR